MCLAMGENPKEISLRLGRIGEEKDDERRRKRAGLFIKVSRLCLLRKKVKIICITFATLFLRNFLSASSVHQALVQLKFITSFQGA